MPAPYLPEPPNPQSQIDADGIFYGWQGLVANATFRTNAALIITNGIKNALTDAAVIAALTLAIKNAEIDAAVIAARTLAIKNAETDAAVIAARTLGIKNALTDIAVIAANTLGIKNALIDPNVIHAGSLSIINAIADPGLKANLVSVISDGFYDAVFDLTDDDIIVNKDAFMLSAALLALASTAERKSAFLVSSDPDEVTNLLARVQTLKTTALL